MMYSKNLDVNQKQDAYSKIAFVFNKNKIKHSVLHGFEQEKSSVGRDLDIMIDRKQKIEALKYVCQVLRKSSYKIIIHKAHYFIIILGYKSINNELYTIEIDLVFNFFYRVLELTDKKLLGTNNNLYQFNFEPINAFAKIFIIRFLAGTLNSSDDKRISEYRNLAIYIINNKLSSTYNKIPKFNDLVNAVSVYDKERLNYLYNNISLLNLVLRNPLKSIKDFIRCSYMVVDRKAHLFNIFPTICFSQVQWDVVSKEIENITENSFITKVYVHYADCLNDKSLYKTVREFHKKQKPIAINVLVFNHKGDLYHNENSVCFDNVSDIRNNIIKKIIER